MTDAREDPSLPGRLLYLYMGSADVTADLAWYNEVLGAELLWRAQAYGADVAAVRVGVDGPALLLADHRPVPSCMPIWAVTDIDAAIEFLEATEWTRGSMRVEVPDGPCLVLTDPGGNQMALLRPDRPNAMQDAYDRRIGKVSRPNGA